MKSGAMLAGGRMSEPMGKSYLSRKKIDVRERLIFPLDVPSVDEAKELVEKLGDSVLFYKLGLEIFMAGGYFELLDWLTKEKGKKAFVDLKFFDVPQTVKSAVRQLKNRGASFVTVHGNDNMLKAAVEEKNGLKVLSVTVLTSLDEDDMKALGFNKDVMDMDVTIEQIVYSRAMRALELNCDGVISSGIEAPRLREGLGEKFLIVCPGIRPVKNMDDQKRTVDVEEAFLNGADYIVVGRPIKDKPDPYVAAQNIQSRIAKLFGATSP